MRKSEPFFKTAQEAAAAVLPMVAPFVLDTPYCVVGHSLGTWLTFELLSAMRDQGLPMPLQVRSLPPHSPWVRVRVRVRGRARVGVGA